MNKKEWKSIARARKLLQLGDKATKGEIKRSYRRMCKKYHPDNAGNSSETSEIMYAITGAYELLMRYIEEYRFPLKPSEHDVYDAEDWWLDRFGQDPLWGKSKRRR